MAAFSEDPPKYAALHWDGKMLRDVRGSDPGTTSELWLCLSQDHLHILKEATGSTSDRQLNRNGSGRGIHGFGGEMGAYGMITALCLTQRPATVEYIGSCQASGANTLDRKVFYLACRHHF
ncbi:hypothetical protein GWK47_029323 [Chionoecetes opilio]|uniref:Uncharacterized protein n=1 Tax=Chionoecetes opilio TaxID=41210 RepID=A0A8J5CRK9_CHIOP|nr:hypothetical protein GWK47_029323 [Chionoecetes opilio]